MKYIQHSSNLGEYMPAFFQMYLKIEGQIDLNTCTDREFSLFFHEYIHFLQDLTTTYCLSQCYYYGEYIQTAVYDIHQRGKGEINVPIRYYEPSHHVKIGDVITDITMGDRNSDADIFEIEKVELESMDELPIQSPDVNDIKVINVETTNGDIYSFGAYAIKESMAYILERHATNDYVSSPEFPYCSAEKIVDFIFPKFGEKKENVLALCDISLMFSNPAEIFYDVLLQLKSKNYIPGKPHDLYAQLKYAKVGSRNNIKDPFTHYRIVAEEARKKLKSYFYSDVSEMYKPYYEWVDRLLDFSIKMRTEDPSVFLDLYYDGNARQNETFIRIVNNLGTPLIRNARQDYFCITPQGISGWTNEVMKSVSQIHELLHDGILKCGLYPWCVKSDKKLEGQQDVEFIKPTEEICLHKPWERCNSNSWCPFAMLWENWGLVGYEPRASNMSQ